MDVSAGASVLQVSIDHSVIAGSLSFRVVPIVLCMLLLLLLLKLTIMLTAASQTMLTDVIELSVSDNTTLLH